MMKGWFAQVVVHAARHLKFDLQGQALHQQTGECSDTGRGSPPRS